MFELLEPTTAMLTSVTNRVERHGDDEVPAISLGIKLSAPNTILDRLSPTLLRMLYTEPEDQDSLPHVERVLPLLRSPGIVMITLAGEFEGMQLRIEHGIDDSSAIACGACKVDSFKLTPLLGGTVDISFRVGTADIGPTHAGMLWALNHQEVSLRLWRPAKAEGEPIDGTQAAYEADHPTPATDPAVLRLVGLGLGTDA